MRKSCIAVTVLTAVLSCAFAQATPKSYSLRLNLHQGQRFTYRLLVERDKPKQSGELTMNYKVAKVDGNTIYLDASFAKLKINKVDRTEDLKAIVGNQVVTMPWTIYSRRTGSMTPLKTNTGKSDVLSYLGEAGIYLAYFQRQSVSPGDKWNGSTTATGGCTGATFLFKDVKTVKRKQFAELDVTKIMFINRDDAQVGPMKMIVDLSTGLPTVVDYRVKNSSTGQISHFRQIKI